MSIKTFHEYIHDSIENRKKISIYLMNGIKLDGTIISYDTNSNCVLLASSFHPGQPQVVFLHAVSTMTPSSKDTSNNNQL
jgi:RNA chaperone Hfq